MARDVVDSTAIETRDDLVAWIEQGCKERGAFRLGTEHEKVPFYRADTSPVPYERPASREGGIRDLLEGLQQQLSWEPISDGAALIGLAAPDIGAAISLEPGGQFELSGAPLESVHEVAREFDAHIAAVHAVAEPLGIDFLSLGMQPKWPRSAIPVMPKQRYAIMARYMPKVGTLGLDMMFRTATVQVNLDYETEADMVKKLRVGLALQPIVTAMFVNSPFTDGKPNGLLSMRAEIWRGTDGARTGMLPFAFEDGMGFERYVDYALDVPMYFVKRGEHYQDVSGASFRDLLAGKLAQLPGERATISDWANHLSTIFPEVRLKRFLEMRGADMGSQGHVLALPALWAGLLYDEASLDGAWTLVKAWNETQRAALRADIPRYALRAEIAGRKVRDVARDVLQLARSGLKRRALRDASGKDETIFLDYLDQIVGADRTSAEYWLQRYYEAWKENIDRAFDEARL
ncbi:MAG: glutamate--cysteine ligase [Methylobacteriaceae bacterium]|jgi:glutamate--cysteine ligase|nr:glutamate--cysteine ligase [Methylobacteriaceae bacterium]